MRILAFLLMVLALGTLAPWAMMAMMSPMVFDAGETPQLWAFFWTLWLYPVWLLAWLVFAILSARAGSGVRAIVLTVIAAAPALAFAAYLGLVSAGLSTG